MSLLGRAWDYIPWQTRHRNRFANVINCDVDDVNLALYEDGTLYVELRTGSLDEPTVSAVLTDQHRRILEGWWTALDEWRSTNDPD